MKTRMIYMVLSAVIGSIFQLSVAQAEIVANFTGGNGAVSPDQYEGTLGEGWTTAWVAGAGGDLAVSGTTATNSPVDDADAPYLSVSGDVTGDTPLGIKSNVSVQRGYTAFDIAMPTAVSFLFRIDSDNTNVGEFRISGQNGQVGGGAGTSSADAWVLSGTVGGMWHAKDGNTAPIPVGRGLKVEVGDVYRIIITENNTDLSYSASIQNLTDNSTIYSINGLNYRTETYTNPFLRFSAEVNQDAAPGEAFVFSVDDISIQQAPTSSLCVVLSGKPVITDADLPSEAVSLLTEAGNTTSDVTRYELLQQVRELPDLPPDFITDLDGLIHMARHWATGIADGATERSDKYLTFMLQPGTVQADAPVSTRSDLLQALHAQYAGRAKLALYVQAFGQYSQNKPLRDQTLAEIEALFSQAYQAFPANQELAMLLCNQEIPWPNTYPDDSAAPAWANLQRRSIEGLTDIIHWWIDQRQAAEGFFGSSWGDDVEMWRVWLPSFGSFHDPKTDAALELLSDGVFSQDYMSSGYMSKMQDVEHSAEDTADTIMPMLLLSSDSPEWHSRATTMVQLAQDHWIGINERGQHQHMGMMFNVDQIDPLPKYAADTTYHSRIYQPAVFAWQRGNAPPGFGDYFASWVDTWVDASMRSERGKPAGILPTTIRWPDGVVGGQEDPWWNPNVLNGTLYRWPCVVGNRMMCNAMLMTWLQTGETNYLAPIFSMAQSCLDLMQGTLAPSEEPGSLGWAAEQLDRFVLPVLARYRLISGDDRFDPLLAGHPSGYMKLRLTGDNSSMVDRLQSTADALSQNMELYTSLCRAGDRVFAFPYRYFTLSETLADKPSPDIELLYAMTTGDPDMSMYGSFAAVRWITSPRQIAALVTHADQHTFEAELFHFGDDSRAMDAELYLLEPGTYHWQLIADGEELAGGDFVHDSAVSSLALTLPPHRLCSLNVAPVAR